MDITCHSCNTVSSIPEAAIPDEGIHFECPHCSTQLFAQMTNLEPEEDLFGNSSLSVDDSELEDDLSSLDSMAPLDMDMDMDISLDMNSGDASLDSGMKQLGDDDISPSMIYSQDELSLDITTEEATRIENKTPSTNNVELPKPNLTQTPLPSAPNVAPKVSNHLESYLSSKSASVQEEKARLSPFLILLMAVLLIGGATGYYFVFMKNKNLKKQIVMTPEIKQMLLTLDNENIVKYKSVINTANNKLASSPNHVLYKAVYVYAAARYFSSIETIVKPFAPDYNIYANDIKKYALKSEFVKKAVIFHDLAKSLASKRKLNAKLKSDINGLNDSDSLLLKSYIHYKDNNTKKIHDLLSKTKLASKKKLPVYYVLLRAQFSKNENISNTLTDIQKINKNHIYSKFYNVRFLVNYSQLKEAKKELKDLDKLKKLMGNFELTSFFILKAKLAELQQKPKDAYNYIRSAEDLKVDNDTFFKQILKFYYDNYHDSTALNMLRYSYKKKYSSDFDISNMYIKLLIRTENYGKAGQISTDLRNKYPKKPEAYYLSALLSDSLENRSMAIDFLKKALSIDNKYQDAIVLLAKEYVAKGKLTEAKELLENATKDLKENNKIITGLALLYFNEKEYNKASKLFQKLLVKNSSDINKIQVDFKLNMINLYLNKQTNKETLRNLYVLYKKNPNFLGLRTEIGKLESESNNFDKSIKIFKEELRIRPNDVDVNLHLGRTYFLKKDYTLAENFLNKAISIDSKKHLAYFYLGKTLKSNNKLNKALDAFATAYSYNKKSYDYLIELARVYVDLNQANEAYDAYAKLIKLKASFDALYEYGALFLKQGDSKNALKYFNLSYQINSKNTNLMLEMGNLFFKGQKYKKAIKFYTKVIKLDSKNPEAYFMIGDSYRSMDKSRKAVGYYIKAIKLNPNEGKYYYQLGYVYKGMKKYRKALGIFRTFLKKVPNTPDRAEIEEEIYDLKNIR